MIYQANLLPLPFSKWKTSFWNTFWKYWREFFTFCVLISFLLHLKMNLHFRPYKRNFVRHFVCTQECNILVPLILIYFIRVFIFDENLIDDKLINHFSSAFSYYLSLICNFTLSTFSPLPLICDHFSGLGTKNYTARKDNRWKCNSVLFFKQWLRICASGGMFRKR